MNENKEICPKFHNLTYKIIDGEHIPHLYIDGALVPVRVTADWDYILL